MNRTVLLVTLLCLLCNSSWSSTGGRRDLTFEQRVDAQEAIERLYYSHQIGATLPVEEAVPRAVLEEKVRTYLKQSVALEEYWRTPITVEALSRELKRILKGTQFPDRLKEMFSALGNDPVLIQECVARPSLVDRLSRNFFASDLRIQGPIRREAELMHSRLLAGQVSATISDSHRTVLELTHADMPGPEPDSEHSIAGSANKATIQAAVDSQSSLGTARAIRTTPLEPGIEGASAAFRESDLPVTDGKVLHLELGSEEFQRVRKQFPEGTSEIGPLQESRDSYTISVVLSETSQKTHVAIYSFPKVSWDEWWPVARNQFQEWDVSAIAANDASFLSDESSWGKSAARLSSQPGAVLANRSTTTTCYPDDTWIEGNLDMAPPVARSRHTAIWTGTLMIIWGGYGGDFLNNGAKYDPLLDAWTAITQTNAPTARYGHTAVWTGTRMLIWGGYNNSGYLNSGGLYDPASARWYRTSTVDTPSPRYLHTAVWTGSRMIVWGGFNLGGYLASGGIYDPSQDIWIPTAETDAPVARYLHTAVWTGTEMIVWGGHASLGDLNSGARFDLASNSWTPVSIAGAPDSRMAHTAVWAGSRMIVWGGQNQSGYLDTGSSYYPGSNSWDALETLGAPQGRAWHRAEWTGSEMIVWGGSSDRSPYFFSSGARYDSLTHTWHEVSPTNAPSSRDDFSAVWTGSLFVIWGGENSSGEPELSGGRYNPTSDTWTPTAFTPLGAGSGNTAIWTGNKMIIWGGGGLNTGYQYDPLVDNWFATTSDNAPSGRHGHSAVWTGRYMIVWGGIGGTTTGGRYDPISDTWLRTSTINAPSPRTNHTAVWTGIQMIVWGGVSDSCNVTIYRSGGMYDPVADTWVPTSLSMAPPERAYHTAIWTGTRMLVFGGRIPNCYCGCSCGCTYFFPSSLGGSFDPATNTWPSMSTLSAPSLRWLHSAVWSGSEMLIWGGSSNPNGVVPWNDGGRYDPLSDSWRSISTYSAPAPRAQHSAVWTGDQMIVWSGYSGSNSGGRYVPTTDSWTPTTQSNAPSERWGHSAVWTDNVMVVWGGGRNDGGRYSIDSSPDADHDGFRSCTECDDTNPSVYPGAPQICDGLNNDCNSASWPSLAGTNEHDADGDGYSPCQGDCSPSDPSVYPGAPQICDGKNNDCRDPNWPSIAGTPEADNDGDSFSQCQGDCDDNNPRVYPWALQLCDGVNNDCRDPNWPAVPLNETDADGDGFKICQGDCDDSNSTVYPGAPQLCDGANNNCSDPNWPVVPLNEADDDGDGFRICGGDCDDSRGTVYPEAPQLCDGINNNCQDPTWPVLPADEVDSDGDGSSTCQGDCNDSDRLVWATPGEVRTLRFGGPGKALLLWNGPQHPGSLFLLYDTIRSSNPSDFVSSAVCVESNDGLDLQATDTSIPATGTAFYYLVRAENTCPSGQGSLGFASSGAPRIGRSCP